MPKYFIDTEFIEGFHKPIFSKRRHFIDLISIGIVCEDGRTYYAISNEYDYKKASKWVRENVIAKIYNDEIHGDKRNFIEVHNFNKYIPKGKSLLQIAAEIKRFTSPSTFIENELIVRDFKPFDKEIEFYGYYSDYDWVLFCSLFGRMIDLPKGYPMYCHDLKQSLDEKLQDDRYWGNREDCPLDERLKTFQSLGSYPSNEDEHNALSDAEWNQKLYKFIEAL